MIDAMLPVLLADAEYTRFEHDCELRPQLTLEAVTTCSGDGKHPDEDLARLLSEVRRLLWDGRLHGALTRSASRSCIRREEPWQDSLAPNRRRIS